MAECWPVASNDLVSVAVHQALHEWNSWRSNDLTESTSDGEGRVREFWRSVQVNFPGISTAWSGVFISWLFTSSYLQNAPLGTEIGGNDTTTYSSLDAASRNQMMSVAIDCLKAQALFHPRSTHYWYVVNTLGLQGTEAVVLDPSTPVRPGDLLLYGRNGDHFAVQDGTLVPTAVANAAWPSSHADIAVEIRTIEELDQMPAIAAIGGNTLENARVVGCKLRPMQSNGQLGTSTPIALSAAIAEGIVTPVGNDYYSLEGGSAYERIQVAPIDAVIRLTP